MIDNFDGDPRIVIDENGADIIYRDGQPVMDAGLENNDLIALFTAPGWPGNTLLETDQQIGSDFEEKATGTITLKKLALIENSARLALSSAIAKTDNISITIANKQGSNIEMTVRRVPPGNDIGALLVTRDGAAWINQAINPANEKL